MRYQTACDWRFSAKMPPMRCTVLSTIDRPSPAPAAAVRAESPRKKGFGEVGELFGGTPAPWSRSFQQHPVFAAFGGNFHAGHAGVGCLAVAAGVFQQV